MLGFYPLFGLRIEPAKSMQVHRERHAVVSKEGRNPLRRGHENDLVPGHLEGALEHLAVAGEVDGAHQPVAGPGLPDVLEHDLRDVQPPEQADQLHLLLRAVEGEDPAPNEGGHCPVLAGVDGRGDLRKMEVNFWHVSPGAAATGP